MLGYITCLLLLYSLTLRSQCVFATFLYDHLLWRKESSAVWFDDL
jgi:hypothetical protein